ncbi:hypothetical protein ABPG73_004500 [Tetrahymena malaccensis]
MNTTNSIQDQIIAVKSQEELVKDFLLKNNSNSLKANAAKLLSKIINNFKFLTQLSLKLKKNNIEFEGAQSLANSIQNCEKITNLELNLSNCNIGVEQSENISKQISEKFSGINHLSLKFKNNVDYVEEEEVDNEDEEQEEDLDNLCIAYQKESISKKIKLTNQSEQEICFTFEDNKISEQTKQDLQKKLKELNISSSSKF